MTKQSPESPLQDHLPVFHGVESWECP